MNERQEYALLHPVNSANPRDSSTDPYTDVRKDRRSGLLLQSILAVDR